MPKTIDPILATIIAEKKPILQNIAIRTPSIGSTIRMLTPREMGNDLATAPINPPIMPTSRTSFHFASYPVKTKAKATIIIVSGMPWNIIMGKLI